MHQLLHRGAAVVQHRTAEGLDGFWDDLRLFLTCAKSRSFRDAAAKLKVTSTTVMRRIDRLEARVGCKLFLRDPSGLTLSDDGAAIVGEVEEMERHALNVSRRAAQSSDDPAGTVRVAATEGPGNFWILPRLIDFQKTYRKVTVDLRCAMEQADVARREADIAIQYKPPTNPDLIITKLGRLHIYGFVSEEYRRLHGVPKSLADIGNHRIVKQHAPQLDDTAYAQLLRLPSLEGGIKTNSSISVLHAVERGAGMGFLPSASIALGASLIAVDLGVSHHTDLWLTYHKDFRRSDRHKIVIDWLRKIFDPKMYPCFRDEFIHPNELVPMMAGIGGYTATADPAKDQRASTNPR